MTLGEKIRALRAEKGLSEDQFASFLGVSYKEIVRWESGKEEPPLSMLPRMALYFEVTTDELLGMDDIDPDELIAPYLEKYQGYVAENKLPEAIATMRDGLIHFPNNYKLKWMLMYALYLSCTRPAVVKHYSGEIFALGDEILENCTDDAVRLEAKRVLCLHCFDDLHDEAQAMRIAKTLPSRASCREELLAHVAAGRQKELLLRQNILAYAGLLADSVRALTAENGFEDYRAKMHTAITLLETIFPKGDYLKIGLQLMDMKAELGLRDLQNSAVDEGFALLQSAADLAKAYDALPENSTYTSPLVKGLTYDKGRSDPPELGSAATARGALLKKLAPVGGMETLRYDERLKTILATIKE